MKRLKMREVVRPLFFFLGMCAPGALVLASNKTLQEQKIVGWWPEPDGRGTWSLLISCTVTLSLCVYTALHLNITTNRNKRNYAKFWIKAWWVVVGIVAPELVAYTAWTQWQSARNLTREVHAIFEEERKKSANTKPPRKHPWTIVHSFYAGMGGFAFETDDPHQQKYIPSSPRAHLTANGVLVLAKLGHLPDISEDEIRDKSKSDDLAKLIAVLQASWLLIQSFARLIAHLPLSPLEINTLAHVTFAMAAYALWWKKPLDVHDPTIISGDWVPQICATMWMFSDIRRVHQGDLYVYNTADPEIDDLIIMQGPIVSARSDNTPVEGAIEELYSPTSTQLAVFNFWNNKSETLDVPVDSELTGNYKVRIKQGQVILGLGLGVKPEARRFHYRHQGDDTKAPELYTAIPEIPLDLVTITRWNLAKQEMSQHGKILNKYRKEYSGSSNISKHGRFKTPTWEYPTVDLVDQFVGLRVRNFPNGGLIRPKNGIIPSVTLSLATAIYGGLHLAAWNLHFPSDRQALYWRISAAHIAVFGVIYSIGCWMWAILFKPVAHKLFGAESRKDEGNNAPMKIYDVFVILFFTLVLVPPAFVVIIVGVGYVAARCYLPIEALISLKSLPIETYHTQNWSQYIPHL